MKMTHFKSDNRNIKLNSVMVQFPNYCGNFYRRLFRHNVTGDF